ncbi:Spondin_N [Planctomycetes bacterium K2D]|nr:Spondin_N [Planctomycetes bacterium K2D]
MCNESLPNESPTMNRYSTFAILSLLSLSTQAMAVDVRVTVTNLLGPTSSAFSPIITSAHSGAVDQFNSGSAASPGVEDVAELGATGATLITEILAQQPTAIAAPTQNAGGGFGPLLPGASQSVVLSGLDPMANRYFSYLSMFVPSNDTFIGNDSPTAIQLFDAGGAFIAGGFTLTADRLWDAGSEVNGLFGSAFIAGQSAADGADEGGVVTAADFANGFDFYQGQTTGPGYVYASSFNADTPIISFAFEVVPEPTTAALAALLALAACLRR